MALALGGAAIPPVTHAHTHTLGAQGSRGGGLQANTEGSGKGAGQAQAQMNRKDRRATRDKEEGGLSTARGER